MGSIGEEKKAPGNPRKRRGALKKEKPPARKIPVRLFHCPPKNPIIPMAARSLVDGYSYDALNDCRRTVRLLDLNEIPRSLNHQYGGNRRGQTYLEPEVRAFRKRLAEKAIGLISQPWVPTGRIAAVCVLISPRWVQKDGHIRPTDLDNRVKVLLDALQECVPGFRDEAIWDLHLFKQHCTEGERTLLYLIDLGDIVPSVPFAGLY